jgi:hypothetical protein
MKKSEKPFDAVKMMREIRDKLSNQFREMSFEEQQQYIRQHIRIRPSKARRTKTRTQTP